MGEELNSPITLSPPPTKFRQVKEFEVIEADIDEVIEVKGFFLKTVPLYGHFFGFHNPRTGELSNVYLMLCCVFSVQH